MTGSGTTGMVWGEESEKEGENEDLRAVEVRRAAEEEGERYPEAREHGGAQESCGANESASLSASEGEQAQNRRVCKRA